MATEYQRLSETAREMGDGACCQMGLIMLLICVCLFVRVSRRRTSDRNTIHSCGWITLIAIQASFCRFLSRARIWAISGYINIRFPLFACLVVLLILPELNFMACFQKRGQSLFGSFANDRASGWHTNSRCVILMHYSLPFCCRNSVISYTEKKKVLF